MRKQKVQEADEKGRAFEELVKFQEERRARETEALWVKHAEERKREIAERKKQETKRESLEDGEPQSHAAAPCFHQHNQVKGVNLEMEWLITSVSTRGQ